MTLIPNLPECQVCGSDWRRSLNSRLLATAVDASRSGFDDFTIRVCNGCGIGFTSPVPTPASASELYSSRKSSNFDGEGGRIVSFVKDALAKLSVGQILPNGNIRRVLDFSTGNGRFAVAASRRFPDATVIATDIQPDAPVRIRNEPSIRYISTPELWSDPKLCDFDLIVMRHVLEHVYDPGAQLADLRERLSSDGAIFIEVPNLTCAWAPLVGKYFPGYYAPYHVHHFDEVSLSRLLSKVAMTGDIRAGHMPLIGNVISRKLQSSEGFLIKFMGISLFPLQVLIEKLCRRASVIRVLARKIEPASRGRF